MSHFVAIVARADGVEATVPDRPFCRLKSSCSNETLLGEVSEPVPDSAASSEDVLPFVPSVPPVVELVSFAVIEASNAETDESPAP